MGPQQLYFAAYISQPGALAMVGLSSRGGTARWAPQQLYFDTYISQPRGSRYGRAFLARRHRRSPSKQLYFATYFQPRSSRYGPAFLARRHRPEALQAAVLRHLPQPAPELSLRPGFPREEAPPGAPPSSCTSPPTSASPEALALTGLSPPTSVSAEGPRARWPKIGTVVKPSQTQLCQ